MISDKFFDQVLIEPVNQGADSLKVISGYATSAMAFHHLNHIRRDIGKRIKVDLVVGMTPLDGLSLSNHRGFQKLMAEDFADDFNCSYIMDVPPIHSKMYLWSFKNEPVTAYLGSANYTQRAFISGKQGEILGLTDPWLCKEYFDNISSRSIFCNHHEAESLVAVYSEDRYLRRKKKTRLDSQEDREQVFDGVESVVDVNHIQVSFINRSGQISARSGLNWGQRPEEGREPNQAYIPLKVEVYKSDFFPPIGQHFTIHTDDNKVIICSRAQQYGKAIHTPHNNSLIGEYFRNRLGVPNGQPVTEEHFLRYGRFGVDFFKIDDETFLMDFSKPS